MARAAQDDGRPLAVFYFADCDPAGWQMGISVARKLQALKILLPKMPDFEVHRVALTPGQVREYGLPSTPLKATEKRNLAATDPPRAATATGIPSRGRPTGLAATPMSLPFDLNRV
jgi:hypothetical protein